MSGADITQEYLFTVAKLDDFERIESAVMVTPSDFSLRSSAMNQYSNSRCLNAEQNAGQLRSHYR